MKPVAEWAKKMQGCMNERWRFRWRINR